MCAGAFAGVVMLAAMPTVPAFAQAASKADDAKKKLESKRNELQDVQKRTQSLQSDVLEFLGRIHERDLVVVEQ